MIIDKINQTIQDTKLLSTQTYFPLSYKALNSEHKYLYNLKIYQDKNESNYYKSKIKNLDLDIFIIDDPTPNAFTVPGVDSISLLKSNPSEYQSLGLSVLLKHPLTASIVNEKQIQFNSDIKKFKVLVFIHSGLIKELPNINDRFSIILHELGHWVYTSNMDGTPILSTILDYLVNPIQFLSILASRFNSEFHKIAGLSFIIKTALTATINIKNRKNEYDADSFVKQMGYSSNLQNALSRLEYGENLNKISIEDKNTWFANFSDIASILFFNGHTHPPTHKRILALQESIGLNIIEQLISLFKPVDKMINSNNGTLCHFR